MTLGRRLFMGGTAPPVSDGLILHLDCSNTNSYPGTGTTWTDLSTAGNNFSLATASAFQSGSQPYMDFRGSYGRAAAPSDISLNDSNGVTYFVITRVLESTASWRTLTRGYGGDHQVIIQSGGWTIGTYDNDGFQTGFASSGFSQQSLPNYGTTNWAALYWRWQSTSPYYQFSYNDTPGTIRGSIANSTYRYSRGFGSIGGHYSSVGSPSGGSQFWGDIAVFMTYNKFLTNEELLQNYNYYKGVYAL